jgi:hypothetical protein
MTIILTTMMTLFVGLLLFLVYVLDGVFGLLAYKAEYVSICVVISCAAALLLYDTPKKFTVPFGVVVFALLASPYFISEPSTRILRQVLIEARPGTEADKVVEIVHAAYHDSAYVMPRINRESNRIHVSLLTQRDRSCTAAIFILKDGVVVEGRYSPD